MLATDNEIIDPFEPWSIYKERNLAGITLTMAKAWNRNRLPSRRMAETQAVKSENSIPNSY